MTLNLPKTVDDVSEQDLFICTEDDHSTCRDDRKVVGGKCRTVALTALRNTVVGWDDGAEYTSLDSVGGGRRCRKEDVKSLRNRAGRPRVLYMRVVSEASTNDMLTSYVTCLFGYLYQSSRGSRL